MASAAESRHPVFQFAPEGVGHVTEAHRPFYEPLECGTGDARRHINNYSLETGPVIVPLRGDYEIDERSFVLPGNVGDGERHARGDRGQQQVGRPRARVVASVFAGLVDANYEISNLHPTAIRTLPV